LRLLKYEFGRNGKISNQRKGRKAMAIEEQGGLKGTGTSKVEPATGKLGVMVVGLGAVSTTLIAGVEAVRRGLAPTTPRPRSRTLCRWPT